MTPGCPVLPPQLDVMLLPEISPEPELLGPMKLVPVPAMPPALWVEALAEPFAELFVEALIELFPCVPDAVSASMLLTYRF